MEQVNVRRRATAAGTGTKADAAAPPPPSSGPLPPPQVAPAAGPRGTSAKRTRGNSFAAKWCRRLIWVAVLVLTLILVVLGIVLFSVYRGPKPSEEMWIDWIDYAVWYGRRITGQALPCTYGGVRFFGWGAAVDTSAEATCDCWLWRCPPSTTSGATVTTDVEVARSGVDAVVAPAKQRGDALTVAGLREMCSSDPNFSPHSDLSAAVRDSWIRATRIQSGLIKNARQPWIDNPLFYPVVFPNHGAATVGDELFATVPTCIQAGRTYYDIPEPPKVPDPDVPTDATAGATRVEGSNKPIWEDDDEDGDDAVADKSLGNTAGDDDDAAELRAARLNAEKASFNAYLRGELLLEDAPILNQFECRAGTHHETPHVLTDVVLRRASKYHPVTAVRGLGLLMQGNDATAQLDTFVQSVLLPLEHIFSALDKLEANVAAAPTGNATASQPWVPFTGWSPQLTQAWLHGTRQAFFLEEIPDAEHYVFPNRATSLVARQLGNSFSAGPQHHHHHDDHHTPKASSSSSSSTVLFKTAPVSRVRHGEKVREPMYCFCQSLMVPNMQLMSPNEVIPSALASLRRRLNTFFGAIPLADAAAENAVVTDTARRVAHPRMGTRFWANGGATARAAHVYTPRLLYISRADRRVADESRLLDLLSEVGFHVETVHMGRDDVTDPVVSGEDWFLLGRYADVVMGAHGDSLTHAAWMDSSVHDCRTLVELLPFGQAEITRDVYRSFMTHAGLQYTSIEPVDARFGPEALLNPYEFAQAQQMRREPTASSWAALPDAVQRDIAARAQDTKEGLAHREEFDMSSTDEDVRTRVKEVRERLTSSPFGPFEMAGFYDQTAVYNWTELESVVRRVYESVSTCLSR